MSLLIKDTSIEISIPNSEASICAQHVGIKDRFVGSYYMSNVYDDVKMFLNNFKGNYYIDFAKTYYNMNKLYDYINSNGNVELFKSCLLDQYAIMAKIEKMFDCDSETLISIPPPYVNKNCKYLKFDRNNEYIKDFEDLLLGDLTCIVVKKIFYNIFVLYGTYLKEYKDKLPCIK